MVGSVQKKRNYEDLAKQQRPKKKQRKQRAYHSDSEDDDAADENPDFKPVNLLDSDDEDLDNVAVDDVGSNNGSESDSDLDEPVTITSLNGSKGKSNQADEDEDEDDEDDDDEDGDEYDITEAGAVRKPKSKRNDPDAFATSISKILSTKLSSSRRADPVLARSAEAHQASKEVLDTALEAKARKHLREQKRLAQEKGRVRDVLIATRSEITGEVETSTTEILEEEKRLRKVAQRGIVKLFNAVRAAQVKAVEADKESRRDGFVGVGRREEKVNEMSKKGFLDLIAGGGGKLKKGALEEA